LGPGSDKRTNPPCYRRHIGGGVTRKSTLSHPARKPHGPPRRKRRKTLGADASCSDLPDPEKIKKKNGKKPRAYNKRALCSPPLPPREGAANQAGPAPNPRTQAGAPPFPQIVAPAWGGPLFFRGLPPRNLSQGKAGASLHQPIPAKTRFPPLVTHRAPAGIEPQESILRRKFQGGHRGKTMGTSF